jgi:hypothetical protein
MLLKRRLRPNPHAANAKVRNPAGRRKIMGQFTLRIKDQYFEISTSPGSARLKVKKSNGSEFFFDPKSQKYFDYRGTGRYAPSADGIDSKSLSKLLMDIDNQRKGALENIALESVNLMQEAVLFDNGDFSYQVHLKPVISTEIGYALDITSQWKSALKPQEKQFRFRACVGREGLVQLRDLIERELAQ